MRGNLINYPNDVGTNMATLLLIKIFLNSVISTPGVRFMSINLANFYLMIPLKRPKFAKIELSDIPEEIRQEYKLHKKQHPMDGCTSIAPMGCMVYLKLAASVMTSLKNASLKLATTKAA